MKLKRTCMVCHEARDIEVDDAAYKRYQDGAYVQDAFKHLDANQREEIITGTHGPCFDSLFSSEETE